MGQCLTSLVNRYPSIEQEIFDRRSRLRGYIEIYRNNESTYPDELNHPVEDGDQLSILFIAIGGG